MAVNAINFRIGDAESDTKTSPVTIYVPTGLEVADYQAFADAGAPLVDAISGGVIRAVDMTLNLSVPGGLKTVPLAGILNERGVVIGMATAGQFNDSTRVPAVRFTLMPGDTANVADPAIANFALWLTAGVDPVFPRTREGFIWEGLPLYAKKSFRRK